MRELKHAEDSPTFQIFKDTVG